MMKFLPGVFLLLLPALAWGAEPFARATVQDKGKIVPGQQVRVDVDHFEPDFLTSPPQFPLFDVPDALITLPEERTQNISETIDGVQYSGIRKSYAVVPQAPGKFVLPKIDIGLGYSVDGKPTRATVRVPSVSFNAGEASGAAGQRVIFAASDLTIEQAFDPTAPSLKVGDALVRTITVTAENTQAMMIPPVGVGTVSGLRQYQKQPKIKDGIPVGRETASRRTETYVYTADREGSFTIPAVSYDWFDVARHEQTSASLPSITVAVSPAVATTPIKPVLDDVRRHAPHVVRQKVALAIMGLLAAMGVLWACLRIWPVINSLLQNAHLKHQASHGYRLKRLRQLIRSGSEQEIYNGLQTWSRSLGNGTLEEWVRFGPADLQRQVDILSQKLFRSGRAEIDRERLAAVVDYCRPARLDASPVLPPLNP
jgi:hypothetical protein